MMRRWLSGDCSQPMSVSGGRGSTSTTPSQPGIGLVGVLALAGRAHPGGEVVVDAEVVERRRDRREVAVVDERVVGEVRGVVEEAVGVGAVEDRPEEDAVERVVGAAHGIRVALVAVVGAPDLGRVEGDRHLGAGGVLADDGHGGAVGEHQVVGGDHAPRRGSWWPGGVRADRVAEHATSTTAR